MKNVLASKEYWESRGILEDVKINSSCAKLITKYVQKSKSREEVALEVGCVPGTFLGFICRELGFKAAGIDYVADAKKITQKSLLNFGVKKSSIFEDNFLTWKHKKTYDLVCSFGFIEHFKNAHEIADKHLSYLKQGGTVIIEMPNFRYFQYALHKMLDKENLERHNVEIMHTNFLNDFVKRNQLKARYVGYAGGVFDFWAENKNPNGFQKIVLQCLRVLAFIGRRIPIHNRYLSPFIFVIAEK